MTTRDDSLMSDTRKLLLAVDENHVAIVLIEIHRIGGTLLEHNELSVGPKIMIACEIDLSVEQAFAGWLKGKNVSVKEYL